MPRLLEYQVKKTQRRWFPLGREFQAVKMGKFEDEDDGSTNFRKDLLYILLVDGVVSCLYAVLHSYAFKSIEWPCLCN